MNTLTPIDKKLGKVVLEAYKNGFSLQSNYFRENAPYVAMAASMQYLTTHIGGNQYSSEWRPTSKGLRWLEKNFGKRSIEADDLSQEA